MISDVVIRAVYLKQGGRVSLANVRSILEIFEETQAKEPKNPLELLANEQVFVQNEYNSSTVTFDSLDKASEYIKEQAEIYGWDVWQISEQFSVTVGRKVSIEAEQVTTVKFY